MQILDIYQKGQVYKLKCALDIIANTHWTSLHVFYSFLRIQDNQVKDLLYYTLQGVESRFLSRI